MNDVLRRAVKGAGAGDGANPLLSIPVPAGAPRPPSKGPSMFTLAAAASKFKRGANVSSQVSREKRELLKKVEANKKWNACSQKIFSDLQELVKPHLAADGPDTNGDTGSDSESSEAGGAGKAGVMSQEKMMSAMQGIVKEFCKESMSVCCDSWEVDMLAKRLKTSNDHLAAAEKSNRDSHSKFMQELSAQRCLLMKAQNLKEHDVKITGSDVVFYDPAQYLEEDQRNLVKEVVEYKLRAELARGTVLEDQGNSNEALKKTVKELEERVAQLKTQLGDEQESAKKLRQEFDQRTKADLNRSSNRPAEKETVAAFTPQRGREQRTATKDMTMQTDAEREAARKKTPPQAFAQATTITCDAGNDRIRDPAFIRCGTAEFSQQADMPQANASELQDKLDSVRKELATKNAAIDDLQRRLEERAASKITRTAAAQAIPVGATPEEAKKLKDAAAEAEKLRGESKKVVDQLKDENRALQRELDNARKALKVAEASGGPVKIVEVESKGTPKPGENKEVQTDGKVASSEHSEEEQAELLERHSERNRDLEDSATQKDLQIKLLTMELKALKADMADVREQAEMRVSNKSRGGGGDESEELQKAAAEAQKLRAKNRALGDELEQSQEKNTKLEVAINELRDKLKCLQEQLRNAGMGHIADRMFDSAGLADILSNKPLTVFDRLYNDALKRVRRDDGYKKMKNQAAQAFLQTVEHIDNGPHPVPPILEHRAGTPSSPGQRPHTQDRVAMTTIGGFDPTSQSSMSQAHHQQFQQPHQQQAPQRERRSSYAQDMHNPLGIMSSPNPPTPDGSQGRRSLQTPPAAVAASLNGVSETAPNQEVEIKVGTRVKAIEGLQFKIGARTVKVSVGDVGTVVQLYPNIGVDWDCLPSVDKVMMQRDMIEAVDMRRSTQDRPRLSLDSGSASGSQQQSQIPPHNASQVIHSQYVSPSTSPNIGLPQMSASSSASDLRPSPGNRLPQMSPQGMAKSSSTPSFSVDPSMQRRLPRLDSPGKSMRTTTGSIAGRSNPGLETVSFVAGAGARPVSHGSSLQVATMEPRRGPPAGGHSASPTKQHASSAGGASLRSRSRSQPPPKLMVSGLGV